MDGDPTQQPRQPGGYGPNDAYYPPNGGASYGPGAPGYPGAGYPGYPDASGYPAATNAAGDPTAAAPSVRRSVVPSPPTVGTTRWRALGGRWAPPNPLDPLIFNFQHRWETNRQFRATAGAAIALTATLLLCACVALATTLTTSAIARAGAGVGGANGTQNTGTGAFNNPTAFPTNTIPAWTSPGSPVANPIPTSKTPQPTANATATSTATATPTGQGGPPITTCNGGSRGVLWALTPCPQQAGQPGTLTIQARGYKNTGVNIILSFGCTGAGCTLDYTPSQAITDGSGNLSLNYTVPLAAANSQVPISGFIQPQGGPQVSIYAAPVQ